MRTTIKNWIDCDNNNGNNDGNDKFINNILSENLRMFERLYNFQVEGIVYGIKNNGRVLIADEMGLGKTVQAIAISIYYENDWPLLIITPSSLRLNWKNEILKWLNNVNQNDINIISQTKDDIVDNNGNIKNKITIISYKLATIKSDELAQANYKVL